MSADDTKTDPIAAALKLIADMSSRTTDGKWLEHLTVECAPHIAEWDIEECWLWDDWPERDLHYEDRTDIGIDAVAKRRSDEKLVAIQCKARKQNQTGQDDILAIRDLYSFISISSGPRWADRWVVMTGDVRIGKNTDSSAGKEKLLKPVYLECDLVKQQELEESLEPPIACPHCEDEKKPQTRDCMQREAVETSVRVLKEHAEKNGGRSRGRIILPCGTGKSRVALRIIERLTRPGDVSAVLCPSIALVAQLRREFLANSEKPLKALAVCSDETAGYGRDLSKDQTADLGQAGPEEIKGPVTTSPVEIGTWINDVAKREEGIGVIFGTYQSSHRIAEALTMNEKELQVLVADEAHRTAGLRLIKSDEEKLRDFTVCHSDSRFPAKFRIYQTATPKIYELGKRPPKNTEWIVRSMDDATVFGELLYRKSYSEAVANEWLTDYRIIALGVNDQDAYDAANKLAAESDGKLSTAQFLRGLTMALVMGGALRRKKVEIRSSINFMNTIAKSKAMTKALQSETVRKWVQKRLDDDAAAFGESEAQEAANYELEHLDAKSNVAAREKAKAKLSAATLRDPHGILNVGIFGEGTDAPSLSAVGFLEARKSPVDVIQAVGRVMRLSADKKVGYIVCPILIPPKSDAEIWLANSGPDDGWKELGQILLALRAHDSRIEDKLAHLMHVYLPPAPAEDVATMVTIGSESRRVRHHGHIGKPGTAESDLENVLNNIRKETEVFCDLKAVVPVGSDDPDRDNKRSIVGPVADRILSGRQNNDGTIEIREGAVQRGSSSSDGTPGQIDPVKSKEIGRMMVNGAAGRIIDLNERIKRAKEKEEDRARSLFERIDTDRIGIRLNLLERSGLGGERAERDVNLLRNSIEEATRHLKEDELDSELDNHFGLDALEKDSREKQADGCTIASLLLMNAAMLHQRIATGGWLKGISGMQNLKSSPHAVEEFYEQWSKISRHDFLPVIKPAKDIIDRVDKTERREGLSRALRHLAAEAERLSESYADMGSDHAGPLFNQVMGNQSSDGAFFSRPPAASLLARLALDVTDKDADWADEAIWKEHRTVDLACGSGTLLAALLTEMKSRAKQCGANDEKLDKLQKLAVEEIIAGLDFNPVSLQLAAAQLTAGNRDIAYRNMGLHTMQYGPINVVGGGGGYFASGVAVGSLELLAQKRIMPKGWELALEDREAGAKLELSDGTNQSLEETPHDSSLEDATEAVRNARIVVMNPPFTKRTIMGEKFPSDIQKKIRERADLLETGLVSADPEMDGFVDKNSIGPMFVALADRCLDRSTGILAMIHPTIALTTTSGQHEQKVLAKRFHIHTLLTCHLPGQINLSEGTGINESMVIAMRHVGGERPPTRIVSLDKFPANDSMASEIHRYIDGCANGSLEEGWGEVSLWPAEKIEAGDWTAAAWRSPELAEEASRIANDATMKRLRDMEMLPAATGQLLRGKFMEATRETLGSFPILKSKAGDAQTRILGKPDEHWIPKNEVVRGLTDEDMGYFAIWV